MKQVTRSSFVHIHIPKTAGTSLRAVFIGEFGPENVGFMMPNRQFVRASELPFKTEELDKRRRAARVMGRLPAFSETIRTVNQQQDYNFFTLSALSAQNIRVATGHLVPTDISDKAAALPLTTIVRDPLERAVSHYRHWQEARGEMWWHDGSLPYADDVSFEVFANDPALVNYQTRWLGNLAFCAVGTTEKMPEFLEEIGLRSRIPIPRLNLRIGEAALAIDKGFTREFIELNSQDYELYMRVLDSAS
jgi:hypothetical protein